MDQALSLQISQRAMLGDINSNSSTVTSSISQGAILSPFFLYFVNDVP